MPDEFRSSSMVGLLEGTLSVDELVDSVEEVLGRGLGLRRKFCLNVSFSVILDISHGIHKMSQKSKSGLPTGMLSSTALCLHE